MSWITVRTWITRIYNPVKHGLVDRVRELAIFHLSPCVKVGNVSGRLGKSGHAVVVIA